jgi:hypothetical protein
MPAGQQLVGLRRELHAVSVRRMHFIGRLSSTSAQELGATMSLGRGCSSQSATLLVRSWPQTGTSLPSRSALRRSHVQVADGVVLEFLFGGLCPSSSGQAADAVALETAVQGRAGTACESWLQRVEAIVERQSVCRESHGTASSSAVSTVEAGLGPSPRPAWGACATWPRFWG